MHKELENELGPVIDDANDCEITSRYIKADQLVLDLDCLLLDFNIFLFLSITDSMF
jgi:hypothetical protein